MGMERKDDFADRRKHLSSLSEKELEQLFWDLAHQVVNPLVELARNHTTPSIERSVLLRMGIDSITTQAIVKEALNKGLLGHGAGNCVWRYSLIKNLSLEKAVEELAKGEGWKELEKFFGEGGA